MTERVLVTGATGFLGSALVKRLVASGATVACLVRNKNAQIPIQCSPIQWENDPVRLIESVQDFAPGVVFHLATTFIAHHEPGDIAALIEANVLLGTAVLEAAKAVSAITVITGSAWQHLDGAHYKPVSLYAATKQALWDIGVHYAREGLDLRELTLFDVYGPADRRKKLIPALLEAAKTGELLKMSSGNQLIDLLYVEDAVEALIQLTTASATCDTPDGNRFVARADAPLSIREVVTHVEVTTGKTLNVAWGQRPDRPNEMTSNWEFGRQLPEWRPRIDLTTGLKRCWEWL